jgi:hypothetical protein
MLLMLRLMDLLLLMMLLLLMLPCETGFPREGGGAGAEQEGAANVH